MTEPEQQPDVPQQTDNGVYPEDGPQDVPQDPTLDLSVLSVDEDET